jgi:acyl-coenzyme A synthetase/AMP-(fatty) acid ligase
MWRLNNYNKNVAVIDESGKTILYDALIYETEMLVHHVEAGHCLVFNLCSNEVGSLIGYVAFVNNRIVPLMLDVNIDRKLLDHLLEMYKPAYIWLPEGLVPGFPEYENVYSALGYALLKTGVTDKYKLHDDLGLLLTTSGSTGSFKLVRQSYANIRANIESIIEYLEMDETERSITTLPMNYAYGISIINTHLYVGASVILTKKTLMQKEFWQQIKEFKATNFGGVPYTYEMLRRLRFLRMDLPSLRYVTQAGGKLSPELCLVYAEGCRALGKDFIVMYGATEATARMSYLPRAAAIEKAGSIGIAIPGGRFELIDAYGSLIDEPEKVGELVYYGDNVTLGYAEKREDLSKPDECHGRLETGDIAKRDADGYYYIVGRKKRFLKLYGNRVNLMEVEELLRQQGYESACVGEDDHMRIFTTSENTEGVHSYIAGVTGINRIAFEVFHIDEIRRNSSGKVLYSELEDCDK